MTIASHSSSSPAAAPTAASTQPLHALAKTIRSKNAGVNKITFDIIFREQAEYERVKRSRVLTRESMAALFRVPVSRISDFVEYEPAFAIKFTMYRAQPSGSAGDGDIFGAQQYAPLLTLEIPA
ncbi:DUF4387 domain-containing protein [Cupriavidus sp. WGtm5]|nr:MULTISPECIES: DUF4387 domain-containing protein [Cupriavidus]MCO4888084.1 DUF4387 domain-containing protein [Cupriavidus sp. WGtm5]ULX52190.1 acyl-CoA synthetase [Cupriavidus taiwanensis]SPA43417.1 conserved exported protein of unknown function [Cupriavidus taiwanensis]